MQNNSFFKHILFISIVALLASCDKDFNEIGSDIIGDDHFGLEQDINKGVTAYNQNLGPIESNDLPINALGIYNNPVFGVTKANFVTQLELSSASVNAKILASLNPEIESVVLTVPYFSTKTATATGGEGTYELDSIYGPSTAKIKLSVHENGYFIRDEDPTGGFTERQKYYTNQNSDFDAVKGAVLNNDVNPNQNNAFAFSPLEYVETTTAVGSTTPTTTRTAPGMRLNLDIPFFKAKIIEAPVGKLANNNVFKDYFRGLYFKVDYSGSEPGNLAMLNFKQGKITIKYKEDKLTTVAGVITTTRVDKSIVLNLTGNSVNLLENIPNPTANPERLYLKGGEGAMTVIDIFKNEDLKGFDANGNLTGPNGISDELDDLRNPADGQKWLINEANLTFHIDKTAMAGASEPNRIYLYDLNNNRPLMDYYLDNSTSSNPKLIKFIHGGIIEKETTGTDKRGIKYKIRITNHIRNLLKYSDSTNVKLGLVITGDVGIITSAKLKTPYVVSQLPKYENGVAVPNDLTVSKAPLSSVINPLGTVLFGNNIPLGSPDYDKRLKLEIYYTKPN
ncbi:MAG: DUF4270 domain-containing protein [Flavobacterium sp.]